MHDDWEGVYEWGGGVVQFDLLVPRKAPGAKIPDGGLMRKNCMVTTVVWCLRFIT